MQFGIANSQIICRNSGAVDQKLVAIGRESPGKRFIIGLTSLADAERYQLNTAALQTQVAPTAPKKFINATGRRFVEPSNASLRAAAALLKADEKLGTWPIPYDRLRTDPKGAGAYPGTMLISVDVPTSGLPLKDAKRYAQFLHFAATAGQTAGLGNGQLPPGYLPMTAANGLGQQAQYTLAAAAAVAAQSGGVTSVTTFTTPTTTVSGGGSTPVPAPLLPASRAPVPIPGPSSVTPPPVAHTLPLIGWILSMGSAFTGLGGWAFPLLLLLGAFCAVASVLGWVVWRWRATR
jgi:hypothetical protein